MAVWKLLAPHYLNGAGAEYEYKEQSLGKGGPSHRKVWSVPTYYNPEDSADNTPPGSGITLVSHRPDPAYPQAAIFTGNPTPDMEPMDDEAKEISKNMKFVDPINSLPINLSQSLIAEFEKQMALVQTGGAGPLPAGSLVPNISAGQISAKEFNELKEMVAQLTQTVGALQAENAALKAAPGRRV